MYALFTFLVPRTELSFYGQIWFVSVLNLFEFHATPCHTTPSHCHSIRVLHAFHIHCFLKDVCRRYIGTYLTTYGRPFTQTNTTSHILMQIPLRCLMPFKMCISFWFTHCIWSSSIQKIYWTTNYSGHHRPKLIWLICLNRFVVESS